MTRPVTRLIASLPTLVPHISARWAAISPPVSPFANSDSTAAPLPGKRCRRLLTSCGSEAPSRSRGTSIWMAPTLSVTTVFERAPLRELPEPRPTGPCVSHPSYSSISSSRAASTAQAANAFSSPSGRVRAVPVSLA